MLNKSTTSEHNIQKAAARLFFHHSYVWVDKSNNFRIGKANTQAGVFLAQLTRDDENFLINQVIVNSELSDEFVAITLASERSIVNKMVRSALFGRDSRRVLRNMLKSQYKSGTKIIPILDVSPADAWNQAQVDLKNRFTDLASQLTIEQQTELKIIQDMIFNRSQYSNLFPSPSLDDLEDSL